MRRWHLEDWRKIYTRMEADWLALPWAARGLASDLIKYAKADGTLLDFDNEEPGEAIARLLCAHRHEVKLIVSGVAALLKDGYLLTRGTHLVIKNHAAAQERLTPEARRKRRQREKEDEERDYGVTENVTEGVTSSVTVTRLSHALSQGVESSRVESSRVEPPNPPSGGKRSRLDARAALVERQRVHAESVLEALNAARARTRSTSRPIAVTVDSLYEIASRLGAGATVDDCQHVIAVCEAEVRQDPGSFRWFNAVSPFRAANFGRKLGGEAGTTSDAARQQELHAGFVERVAAKDITGGGR